MEPSGCLAAANTSLREGTGLLTEVAGEEERLGLRGPLLEIQAVVGSTLHTEGVIAARELVEASLRLLQLEQLLLQQLIPSQRKQTKSS